MALPASHAVRTVHYTAPALILCYYLLASLWSVCVLDASKNAVSGRLNRATRWLTALVIATFAAEAIIVIVQIFTTSSGFATKDNNVYLLSGTLLWMVFLASVASTDQHSWYPYTGSWFLTLCADAAVASLTAVDVVPRTGAEWTLIAFQFIRDLTILTLLVLYYAFRAAAPGTDEETTPLLESERRGSHPSSSATANEADEDEEEDEHDKKHKAQVAKIEARLKQDGNWLTYVRGFSVFFPHIWPFNRPLLYLNMIGVGICMLAGRALNILSPRQLGILTNALAARSAPDAFTALIIYALLHFLDSYSGIEGLRSLLWLPVESNAERRLETASYDHIMELSCEFHDSKSSGELYAAMSQGRSIVQLLETLLYSFAPIIIDLAVACVYFYFLFDVYLVLIGVSMMVIFCWVSIHLTSAHAKIRRKNNKLYRQKNQVLYDTMGGWKNVVYFNRTQYAEDKFASSTDRYQRILRQNRRLWYGNYAIQSAIIDLGSLGAQAFAAYQVLFKGNDVGTFVTLVIYWRSFANQLPYLTHLHRSFLRGLVDAEELLALFKTKRTVEDGPNELSVQGGHVEFEKVGFSYDGKKEIITNLSFEGNPGKTVALVGETGAGKTTILKLLFRFYDTTEGSITIDGQDIRNVTLSSVREQIGVVPQDPTLFNDTVKANVRFARLAATDDEVIAACKAAAIHDKILTFTNGYETKVGEHGVKLSGGELQRVAIARAILKNPNIILLDEATSSVDSETEAKIQEGLKQLCQGRTTFVVAHRLSTVMDADQIIVMKDGTILEQGTPAELLKEKGKYHKLWTRQMGIFIDPEEQDKSDSSTPLMFGGDASKAADSQLESLATDSKRPSVSTDGKSPKNDAASPASGFANVKAKGDLASPLRPEAPEFVPLSRRTSDITSDTTRFESSQSTYIEGIEGQGGARRPGSSRGSFAQDDSALTTSASDAENSNALYSVLSNRRASVRSEPGAPSMQRSKSEGPSTLDGSAAPRPHGAGAWVIPSRRQPSPGEPSVNSERQRALLHQNRRRRQRNTDRGASVDSGDRVPTIGEEGPGASEDSAAVPGAPNPSPAGASTPRNDSSRPNSSA